MHTANLLAYLKETPGHSSKSSWGSFLNWFQNGKVLHCLGLLW